MNFNHYNIHFLIVKQIDIEFPKLECLDSNDPNHQNFSQSFLNALSQLSTTLKSLNRSITATVGPNDYQVIPGIAGLVDWVNVIVGYFHETVIYIFMY